MATLSLAHEEGAPVNVGLLPTSKLYFLKEWGRGLQRLFTFNSIKKVELELKILDEKAVEAQEVEEAEPNNIEAIKKALTNYQSSHDRLEARLRALKETSRNPNADKLLSNLAERVAKHEELFAKLKEKVRPEEKGKSESAKQKVEINVTNLLYPEFDAKKEIKPGESYSFTFEKVSSRKYHNHLNPSVTGTVNVVE